MRWCSLSSPDAQVPSLQSWCLTPRTVMLAAVVFASALTIVGCDDSRSARPAGEPIVDVPLNPGEGTADNAATGPGDRAMQSLARASRDEPAYRGTDDTVSLRAGTILGRVNTTHDVSGDSAIVPTHDLEVCKPFTDSRLPSTRRGVGNAVVWLLGVAVGPMQDASRRATLTLDRCQLTPRVQRMATGGTVQITSRDAMMSSLRFVSVADASVRATVALNDAGQVVPNSEVAVLPGLVEVRDDRHPWVRAYLAVASHPFVAVTEPDGTFRFGAVPPGSYTLLVWQEQVGVRTQTVRVTTGVETRVSIEY